MINIADPNRKVLILLQCPFVDKEGEALLNQRVPVFMLGLEAVKGARAAAAEVKRTMQASRAVEAIQGNR